MSQSAYSPGLYLDVSNEDYHADGAVGSTGAKRLVKNPPKYWAYSPMNPKRPEDSETIATKFGQAYHTLILEPHKFDYKIKKGCKTTTLEGHLAEGEYETLLKMKDVLLLEPDRAQLVQGGFSEVSFFWTDEATGVMCKIRVDHFTPMAFTDLKSTTDIDNSNLRYEIPKRGWDVSGYMYCEGSRVLKQMTEAGYQWPETFSREFIDAFMRNQGQLFAFMAQEKDEPYEVRTMMLTEDVAKWGAIKFREAMDAYKRCRDSHGTSRWPSKYGVIENMDIDNISRGIEYS